VPPPTGAVHPHKAAQINPVEQAQFLTPVAPQNAPSDGMRIRVAPRSNTPDHIDISQNVAANEWVVTIDGGVKLLIDGAPPSANGRVRLAGTLDIEADRMVVWVGNNQRPDINGQTPLSSNTPLEIYMEGNVVFREEDRVVQARAMYYNVNQRMGTILDAELLSPIPKYQGLARLKADVLRQVDQDRFVAQNASLTTSRMGIPTYEFKSGTLVMEDEQVPAINPITGQVELNAHGDPVMEHDQLLTGQNNVILIEGIPVFYWPFFATDLQRPPLYLDSIAYKHDDVFGNRLDRQFRLP
jgi:hypothetical protein